MMKRLILIAALALAGCSVGQSQWDKKAMEHTKVAFVGIPTILGIGFTGTTTPVTATTSLTNKHVAYPTLRRIISTHPRCDLALIKQDNSNEALPKIDDVVKGQNVTLYGYSGRTMLPVSGRGKVLGRQRDKNGCTVMYTDAGSVQGMSGGAVFNDSGKLVGIIYGADFWLRYTYFIPASEFPYVFTRNH